MSAQSDREGMFVRERSGQNVREGLFMRESSQGAPFQATIQSPPVRSQEPHSFEPWPSERTTASPYLDPQRKQQNVKTFLAQKSFRARQATNTRKHFLWFLTVVSLLLSWVIGYFQQSFAVVFLLVVAMVMIWRDQSGKMVRSLEQEMEIRLRRRKTVQHAETAEWVNLAINRWWGTCSGSVVDFLRDYIEPLLQDVAPMGIESMRLIELDLSNQTPFVKNVQFFDPPESTRETSRGEYPSTAGACSPTRTTFIASMDVGLLAPDSKMVLSVRLGGRRAGYDTLVYVEGLHVSGSAQAVVTLDYEAPFPHVASITATFVRKPDIWVSVKVMKGLKITEVPLLSNWMHSLIMDIFTTLLVDPGKLTLNFQSSDPPGPSAPEVSRRARGVITVTVRGSPPGTKSQYQNDPRRWCTVRLGEQKHQLQLPVKRDSWHATFSFLVYNLQDDTLVVKVKHRRVMRNMTLGVHSIPLSSLRLVNELGEESAGERSLYMHNSEANLGLDFDYTPLPAFSLHTRNHFQPLQVSGVLYVHVHSGSGLASADPNSLSDPYCVVLANKKKVLTTHYILDSLQPQWERGVELFVADFTEVSLTFVVYDWDGPLVGDDLLGVAKLNLTLDQPEVLQRRLELEVDGSTQRDGQSLGHITVSTVFRSVNSVAHAELPSLPTASDLEDPAELTHRPLKGKKVKKLSKILSARKMQYPCENRGVVEFTILQGRNLVPMDSNGLSNPYVVVKYGQDMMFKTQAVKKSLNPDWHKSVTLSAPPPDKTIKVECWDKDRFSDNFMGSIQLSEDGLARFQDGPKWCRLDHVKTGELLLGIKKIFYREDDSDWSHLDEASRPLVGASMVADSISSSSSAFGSESVLAEMDSRSDTGSSQMVPSSAASGISGHTGTSLSPSGKSMGVLPSVDEGGCLELTEGTGMGTASGTVPGLKRRHTVCYPTHKYPASAPTSRRSHDDGGNPTHPCYPETKADIQRALKGGSDGSSSSKRSTLERGTRQRQATVYHNISGQVIEADGLKGELDHLELYIKVRLNTRPSYQRQQKFGRGPVVHKTRVLRGTSNPQWREDFMVKESPVPSDTLLTVDLKSGSKIKIGTHTITLDKFFEGNLKATRWLDIGNDMKLRIRMTRQPTPDSSPIASQRLRKQ